MAFVCARVLLSTFWHVCVRHGSDCVGALKVMLCVHILNVRELYIFICQPSACRLSHQDNYPEPQVDSYVCQSVAFFFLLSAKRI